MAESATTTTDEIRDLYVQTAPSVDEVGWAARAALERVLTPALRALDAKSGERVDVCISAAVRGVCAAIKKTGDPVWHASRGAMEGVVQATHAARCDLAGALRCAARTLVGEQLSLEGDFGAAAKGAVQGAILASENLGLDARLAARLSAQAALEAAAQVRKAAAVKVRTLVGQSVGGYPTGLAS